MGKRVLVAGGAGYVGAHCARAVAAQGHEVVVLDDLSQGHAEAVDGELVVGDIRDRALLAALMKRGFDAVMHFVARTSVPESLARPVRYFDVNVGGTLGLLQAMSEAGCGALVFSSSCAVYGVPTRVPIDESVPFQPISPYGETKAIVERLLHLERQRGGLRSVALRYFNAAGAASDGWLGESHTPETHLIPLALEAAAEGHPMTVNGTDHPTPDGTCVRDYVHVEDLAAAHLAALEVLLDGRPGGAWNLGSGVGSSVTEVLDTVERVTGRPVQRRLGPARAGDPPRLVADTRAIERELGWKPHLGLEDIVRHAWAWHRSPRYGEVRTPPSAR